MLKVPHVTIDPINVNKNEYIIRDTLGITLGRIFIVELSKENRYCNFRIKFYKSRENSYELLKQILEIFCMSLFKDMNINKINVIADEEINIMSFTDLGFILEGIISSSIVFNNIFRDELLFGIDYEAFRNQNINKSLKIKGKNIDISVLIPSDAENLLDYYSRNKEYLKPFEPDRDESFYTLDYQRRNLIEGYKQFLNGDSINFGIYKNNKFIGKIQISNIVMGIFRSAFVGYSIDKSEQGKGYMKEALNLVAKYAFEEMDLHRLEASTLVENLRSQGVLKSCGFKELGINEKYLFINGKWRDHVTFYKSR
ncbi:GNAT family N-acetyltransferase [Clostridium sp. DJ247]|uniref:GNAT family N-acetyltransferase n=1 Tax=Clostridium sp. DJ247 TaxID=2726188 RepID=UPI001625B5E3|nr:GNAT family protein [Clostridium sp. DJ247]MBC2582877.1 GNAT family N-acetyltransferase [Clostridium sp. DJ247]